MICSTVREYTVFRNSRIFIETGYIIHHNANLNEFPRIIFSNYVCTEITKKYKSLCVCVCLYINFLETF